MTGSTPVEIHEFSTGIRPERTADGGWVSRGFTGQYMNATIPEIPHAVERSIANKEFAVAEGASSEQPAVIGRVVQSDESAWSVIAIVTRGRDEKGRSASLYRYFLCQGDKSLPNILAWIEDHRQRNGRMPIFNPFETKVVGNPNISYVSTPHFGDDKLTLPRNFSESVPVIIDPKEYNSEKELHWLAIKKANCQPIAWAFNVEALEQPGRFQIIQAASDKAYELLQKAKVNTPQLPVPVVADEQAIKSAIKGLINSSTAKPEYVEAIANSLGNTQIPESYWRDIFDGQGADKALKQGLYTDQFVRLFVLKAIVIPETLPEYLVWLEKGNKQNDPYKVAAEFEAQFSKSLKQISANSQNIETSINKGIQILLSSLLSQKVSSEAVNRLLTSPNGLWTKLLHQFIKDYLGHDLNLMHQFASGQRDLPFKLTDTSWQRIWKELKIYWQPNYYEPKIKYKLLAHFFENFKYWEQSAFFYQISCGDYQVPKKIFEQLNVDDLEKIIYGLKVTRKPTAFDYLRLLFLATIKLGEIDLKVVFVIPLMLLIMVLSFVTGSKVSHQSSSTNTVKQKNEESATNNYSASSQNNDFLNKIPEPKKEEAIKDSNVKETQIAIEKIVNDIKREKPNLQDKQIIKQIQIILNVRELDYNAITKKGDQRYKLAEAIYLYQKNKFQKEEKAYGYIADEMTINSLKDDIKKYQQIFTTN